MCRQDMYDCAIPYQNLASTSGYQRCMHVQRQKDADTDGVRMCMDHVQSQSLKASVASASIACYSNTMSILGEHRR